MKLPKYLQQLGKDDPKNIFDEKITQGAFTSLIEPMDPSFEAKLREKLYTQHKIHRQKKSFLKWWPLFISLGSLATIVVGVLSWGNLFFSPEDFIDKAIAYYQEQSLKVVRYTQNITSEITYEGAGSFTQYENRAWKDQNNELYISTQLQSSIPGGTKKLIALLKKDPASGLLYQYSQPPSQDAVGYQQLQNLENEQKRKIICKRNIDGIETEINIPPAIEPITISINGDLEATDKDFLTAMRSLENTQNDTPEKIIELLQKLQKSPNISYQGEQQGQEGKLYRIFKVTSNPDSVENTAPLQYRLPENSNDRTDVIMYFNAQSYALEKEEEITYRWGKISNKYIIEYMDKNDENILPEDLFDPENYHLAKGASWFYLEGCYKERKIMTAEDEKAFFDSLPPARKKELEERITEVKEKIAKKQ